MVVIRVGEGQEPSGKVLDCGTHSYVYDKKTGQDERLHAIEYAQETGRKIYISQGKRAYREVTIEKLMSL